MMVRDDDGERACRNFNPLALRSFRPVTFATAAVGSPKSTATSNYTAAAVFPRSPNVAVTYVFIFRGAARRI